MTFWHSHPSIQTGLFAFALTAKAEESKVIWLTVIRAQEEDFNVWVRGKSFLAVKTRRILQVIVLHLQGNITYTDKAFL